jgi:hypothetical protein
MSSANQMFYGLYHGICVNDVDPEGLFRVQAVVPQVFGNATTLTDWAWPCFPPGTTPTVPVPGQGVWISFVGGDIGYPVWLGVWMSA